MKKNSNIDITHRPNEAAITALCTFSESVSTRAGRVTPESTCFLLHVDGRKPREFATASGAVEVLRRISR